MPNAIAFPDTIDTERLVLRRYSSADAPGISELVEKNRDRLIRNFSQMAKGMSQVEEAIAFTEQKGSNGMLGRASVTVFGSKFQGNK